MAKVAILTLYDESCGGARSISSYLNEQGHECHIIHFKAFRVPLIRYEDEESWRIVEESKSKIIPAYFPEGVRFISFPTPVTGRERDLLIEKLVEIGPDVIGLSLLSTHIHLGRELCSFVRERLPGVSIMWGGIHAMAEPEDCFPDADIVCIGEGEEALTEYLADPKRRDIQGLWFYDRKTREIIKNPMRRFIPDLDSLPFPHWGKNEWLIEDGRVIEEPMDQVFVRGHFRVFTTRNCPFKCAYCVHSMFRDKMKGLGPYVRRRSPDNVIEEVVLRQRQFNLPEIRFGDEVFVMGMKWIEEFAAKYKERVNLPFFATCHPRTTTREMLAVLKDAGLSEVCVGIQSGSPRILNDVFERNTTNEQIVKMTEWFHEIGFDRIQFDLLSYTPYENEEDCRKTLEFLGSLPKPFDPFVYKLVSFPTCKMDKMNHPKGDMDHNGFFFFNMLYLLTQNDKVPMETIRALSHDRFLRERPMLMTKLVRGILGGDDQFRGLDWKITELEFQLSRMTWTRLLKKRLRGVLPSPVWNTLRRGKAMLTNSTAGVH